MVIFEPSTLTSKSDKAFKSSHLAYKLISLWGAVTYLVVNVSSYHPWKTNPSLVGTTAIASPQFKLTLSTALPPFELNVRFTFNLETLLVSSYPQTLHSLLSKPSSVVVAAFTTTQSV